MEKFAIQSLTVPPSSFLVCLSRSYKSSVDVPPAQAQDQPQAPHPVHHGAAAGAGAEVPPEAVPVNRRARRVFQLSESHRDAGEDLVPEQTRQGQAAARSRAGETEAGG